MKPTLFDGVRGGRHSCNNDKNEVKFLGELRVLIGYDYRCLDSWCFEGSQQTRRNCVGAVRTAVETIVETIVIRVGTVD